MDYPFRLGTTSYIIPAGILQNARYLAGKVRDIELVLFELDGGLSNLPSSAEIAELRSLASDQDLTFTVHLPLDLRLDEDGKHGHLSLKKARRVIDSTRGLSPWAYVAHLDGRAVLPPGTPAELKLDWQDQAVQALELVAGWIGEPQKLALENLEGYPLDINNTVLERTCVSRTVDVGHLWLDGHDPLPYLQAALPRTRVIHIHGIAARDHCSLAHVPEQELHSVIDELVRSNYAGIVTIEIFDEHDFLTSLQALNKLPL